jgi:Spy/CpxP family protein refolding chaperone
MEAKIKYLTITVIILSVISLSTLFALFYGNKRISQINRIPQINKMPVERGFNRGQGGMFRMDYQLNLTDNQASKIRDYRNDFFNQSRNNMNSFHNLRSQLRTAYLSGNESNKETQILIDSIAVLTVQNEKSLANHFKSIYEILDNKQREEFKSLINNTEIRMHGRRPMHRYNDCNQRLRQGRRGGRCGSGMRQYSN